MCCVIRLKPDYGAMVSNFNQFITSVTNSQPEDFSSGGLAQGFPILIQFSFMNSNQISVLFASLWCIVPHTLYAEQNFD